MKRFSLAARTRTRTGSASDAAGPRCRFSAMALRVNVAVVAMLAGAFSWATTPVAAGEGDRALVERIVRDWRERAKKLFTIRCAGDGTATRPKGCYNGDQYLPDEFEGDAPSADYTYPCRFEWLFDFQKNRFRIEAHEEAFYMTDLVFLPACRVTAFDGRNKPRRYAPREWNTARGRAPPEAQPEFYLNVIEGTTLTTLDQILLMAHGTVARHGTAAGPKNMSAELCGPDDFVVHGRAEREGRECIVLRSIGRRPTQFTEYWVDAARDSAVVHWESRSGKNKYYEFNIDYKQVAQLWLPTGFEYTKYTSRPENPPEVLCRIDFSRIEPNIPVADETFVLTPQEGMLVWDAEKNVRYRFGEEPPGPAPEPLWRGFGVVALVAVVGALLWRRRSIRRSVQVRSSRGEA